MKLNRLMELAGFEGKQINELETDGMEVSQNKDTVDTLRTKLKNEGINTSSLSDILILKFANAMKNITIESLRPNKKAKVVNERLMNLAGIQLNELEDDGMAVTKHKDTIDTLRAKLKAANVDVSNMSNVMVLKYAEKMKDITIEAVKNGGKMVIEMDQEAHTAINWLDRQEIQDILERYGFAVSDDESTDELRDALRDSVMDGSIDMNAI